jgi:uncharacterized membrane protein YccC
MKDMFERLLKACEALARSETAALKGRDFSTLAHLRDTKEAILSDMESCAGRKVEEPAIRARVERLIEMNQANSRLLAEMKAETHERLRQVRTAVRNLHSLRPKISNRARGNNGGFEAHG